MNFEHQERISMGYGNGLCNSVAETEILDKETALLWVCNN